MEKPDEHGYVHVTWPSKNIPHGGIFHTRPIQPSGTQQEFLKVLLEESKLTAAQRQKNVWKLREETKEEEEQVQMPLRRPFIRPRTSKRRSLSAIKNSGDLDLDGYRPTKIGEDREKMKERLAKVMAYGDTEEQVQTPLQEPVRKPPKLPSDKEKRNELLTQIRERVDWLAEMEYLGHAAPHREIIQEQIAERMRALDMYGEVSLASSARSSKSGFSTLRSTEKLPAVLRPESKISNASAASSKQSVKTSSTKGKDRKKTASKVLKEENVEAYAGHFSPLQYSPRRRV